MKPSPTPKPPLPANVPQKRRFPLRPAIATTLLLLCLASPLEAAITWSGDLDPTDPTTWTLSTRGYIGKSSTGSITVDGASALQSNSGFLGYDSGSSGTAMVTGPNSMWAVTGSFIVGVNGTGALCIEAGGQVSNKYSYLGYYSGSSGMATITDAGSALNISDSLHVGYSGTGTLHIENGGQVNNSDGFLGYNSLSSGSATVTGAGSTWTNSHYLEIGHNGTGTLRIEAGGQVNSAYCYLGSNNSHSGNNVTVTGAGSTWTNTGSLYVREDGIGVLTVADGGLVKSGTLYASLASLNGNGTITAQGAVLDADFRFDAAHRSQATVSFGSGGTLTVTAGSGNLGAGYKGNGSLTIAEGVTINSDTGYIGHNSSSSGTAKVTGTGSKWINNNHLYIGGGGAGALQIEAGGQVSNSYGYLGDNPGSSGTVTVTGSGSTWTNRDYLYIGNYGSATLRIEAGGQVSNAYGYLANNSGSSGVAMVTGVGSKWTNNGILYIGHSYGIGTLHIRDGGTVTASSVDMGINSFFTIDAGYGSNLRIGSSGTGTISGNIRLLTGPQPAAGTQYAPISAGVWSFEFFQSLGGTWNFTNHTFTVSQALAGISGTPVTVNPAQQQRVSITDAARNWSAGASFLAKTETDTSFNFTATSITDADLTALSGLVDPGQSVLNGWNFSATGKWYVANDPVYLSLGIPANLSHGNVQLWRFYSGSWSSFNVDDLTVNDGYASFTSTGLGKYAVSAVPEPNTIALLALSALALFGWPRKRQA